MFKRNLNGIHNRFIAYKITYFQVKYPIMIKWTERSFSFGFPLSYLPLFIERLNCTAPRIEEIVKNMSDAALSKKIEGHWSIKEHIGHLSDLEELHSGRIDDYRNELPTLRAADMTNKKTHEADHNRYTANELIARFRKTREAFIKKVEETDARYFEIKSLHPRLQQEIGITDLLSFVAEHDVQHLAAISAIAALNP